MSFKLLKTEGAARRGEFTTVHGVIQTPVFMNVGTSAAIKGGVSTLDLKNIKCQVELSNTYHLHVRPGEDVIYKLGGIHKFFNWQKPVLTDSGGFQVFSLAKLRNISEEGVHFQSHMDGAHVFMSPEVSMQIQSKPLSDVSSSTDTRERSAQVGVLRTKVLNISHGQPQHSSSFGKQLSVSVMKTSTMLLPLRDITKFLIAFSLSILSVLRF